MVISVLNWRAYDRILAKDGVTAKDRNVTALQDTFLRGVEDNPGYERGAKRNSVIQPMLFIRSGVRYKINAVALPGDELYPGDLVEVYDEMWICVETQAMDTIHTTGLLWLCNHEFKWQDFGGAICKVWGVFDSGVYSTTRNGDEQFQYLDKQFKIYLPYNEETKKIFVDKRMAVGEQYDPRGDVVLSVYSITGVDTVSQSYGKNAHLLVLNARSNVYNPATDNAELGICDYVNKNTGAGDTKGTLLSCEIKGKKTIAIGKSNVYEAVFYDAKGAETREVVPDWSVLKGETVCSYSVSDGKLKLSATTAALVGETVIIQLKSEGYRAATKEVEVRAYG